MLMRKSAPHPRSRKTPSGGRIMAKMILQMSLAVTAMVMEFGYVELFQTGGDSDKREAEDTVRQERK